MHRTPPDGEHEEQSQEQERPQQRRWADSAQPADLQYYGEEQPQQPKVRRASLHLDPATISPSTSARLTRIEKSLHRYSSTEKGTLSETSTRLPRVEKSGTTRRSAARLTPPERHQEEQPEGQRIMVTQGKRKNIYEPPTPVRRSRGKTHLLFKVFQKPGQPMPLLLIGSGLLIFLIVLPLLVKTILVQPQKTTSIVTNGGTNIGSAAKETGQNAIDTTHDLVIIPPKNGHPAPPVYATSAFLMDADTGAVLYAQNPFMHLPMLSTTKLMTATLAVEQGNLDQKITINDAIANDVNQLSADSSVMGVKKGETYTLRDLLYGMLLVSGNDAAIVIADGLDGSLAKFVGQMNTRAAQLGMHDTHYMNPHGLLADNHYSSAHDLAIIGLHAFKIAAIHQISGTREYKIPQTNEHAAHDLLNGNEFLWWYPGVDAGKPGYDGATDFVQVISCIRNNHHLIGVTMNTIDWWTDMRDLMNWGFNNYTWVSPRDTELNGQTVIYDYDWNYFVKDKRENTIPLGNQGRYYIYSGYSLTGPLLTYYDKNGGFKKFGYPQGPAKASNNTLILQQFDHGVIQCNLTNNQCQLR
jgi:D-alanyl-D-alanine carboxypeptidase